MFRDKIEDMYIDVVWNSGSGEEDSVKKAFKSNDASGRFEERISEDLNSDDLIIVYEESEKSPDGNIIKRDEKTNKVWSYLEKGSVVGGKGNKISVYTTEGQKEEANSFEYKEWGGNRDVTVIDSDREMSGEVVRVED